MPAPLVSRMDRADPPPLSCAGFRVPSSGRSHQQPGARGRSNERAVGQAPLAGERSWS